MASERVSDVLVVGAGPAGSATAWALARAGLDVLVLDRARFPRDKPCSEYLSPEASRVLDAMGALALAEAAGAARLAGMRVRAPNGAVLQGDFAAEHGFRGFRDRGLALRRIVLDEILVRRARAAGARVAEGVRVTDLVRDARGAVCGVETLAAGGGRRDLRARLVVGADGLRSLVARRLGVARAARAPRRLALVTHYRGVAGLGDYGEMFVEREGYAGIAPVGAGLANVAVVVPIAEARAVSAHRAAYVARWIAARPYLARRFARAEPVGDVYATGPFASRVRRAWAPGAALVGDAADFFDPFTGEGIYAALRGGEMLAPALCEALDAPSPRSADDALAAYDAARRREFGGKWIVERLVGLAVGTPPLMNRAALALARRKDLADLLVGVAGDFVPAREVLRFGYILRLIAAAMGTGNGERGTEERLLRSPFPVPRSHSAEQPR